MIKIYLMKKKKFINQALGVDEGFITIPKNENEYNNSSGNQTSRFRNNSNLKIIII